MQVCVPRRRSLTAALRPRPFLLDLGPGVVWRGLSRLVAVRQEFWWTGQPGPCADSPVFAGY